MTANSTAQHAPSPLVVANNGVRFLLKTSGLAAIGFWAWQASDGGFAGVLLTAVAFLATAAVWGVFRDDEFGLVRVSTTVRLTLEAGSFTVAAVALAKTTHPALAAAFAVVAVISGVLDHKL